MASKTEINTKLNPMTLGQRLSEKNCFTDAVDLLALPFLDDELLFFVVFAIDTVPTKLRNDLAFTALLTEDKYTIVSQTVYFTLHL